MGTSVGPNWKPIGCQECETIQESLKGVLRLGATVTDCYGYWHGERYISTEYEIPLGDGRYLKSVKIVNHGPIEKNVHEDFRWIGPPTEE
jgi:hypothetical protein